MGVSLNVSSPIKISKGAIDWMPANESKTAYYLDWAEFAKFMAANGHRV